jgi:nucleotide-binding universal stress UspA family protein
MSEITMYKHILLPVDGSEFGMGAIPYAVKFAKAVGARLTAIIVTAPYETIAVGEISAYLPEAEYRERAAANATEILTKVKSVAEAAGVPITAYHAQHTHPWEAIIETAKERDCDLILMASHGRRGIAGVLLGSETKKVLTHTTIPVLVWRA